MHEQNESMATYTTKYSPTRFKNRFILFDPIIKINDENIEIHTNEKESKSNQNSKE